MGKVTDKVGIPFHMLNGSKGSAVWSPRAQLDRKLYKGHMQDVIFNYLDLDARATSVSDLVFDRQMASSNSTRSVWGTVTGV
jgi:tRNA uridine 5-carboxymethylaminomethyl modification enzyme